MSMTYVLKKGRKQAFPQGINMAFGAHLFLSVYRVEVKAYQILHIRLKKTSTYY